MYCNGEEIGIVNVDDYKGTIYNDESRQENNIWYKNENEPYYSDALDNWNTRTDIDEKNTYTSMVSTTPEFNLYIEDDGEISKDYLLTTTSEYGDELTYDIKSIDFGIAERPRQELRITKEISKVTIKLANDQSFTVDIETNENGEKEISGTIIQQYAKYLKESASNPTGEISAELDDEVYPLNVTIDYDIKVENVGEIDYKCENYYKFGKHNGYYKTDTSGNTIKEDKDAELVKLKATGVYDYMDQVLALSENISLTDTTTSTTTTENISVNSSLSTEDYINNKLEFALDEALYDENGNIDFSKGTDELNDILTKALEVYGLSDDYPNTTIETALNILKSKSDNSIVTDWEAFAKINKLDRILEEWTTTTTTRTKFRSNLVDDKFILQLKSLEEAELSAGESRTLTMSAKGTISNKEEEIKITNDVEIAGVNSTNSYGRKTEDLIIDIYDRGEVVTITPPTGENRDYTADIVLAISVMALFGVGIIFIKKKVLKRKA